MLPGHATADARDVRQCGVELFGDLCQRQAKSGTLIVQASNLQGGVTMLGGLMALAAWLARDEHTDPRPDRDI